MSLHNVRFVREYQNGLKYQASKCIECCTMASLLQYCLQKRKTVSLKTVKSPSQFFHKDLRLTKKSHFWSSVHAILSKIEPKETRVDPKNTEKRPIYDIKLFCSTFLDLWAMPHMFPIYAQLHGHISALSLLEPSI